MKRFFNFRLSLLAFAFAALLPLMGTAFGQSANNPTYMSPISAGVGLTNYHTGTTASTNCHLISAGNHVMYRIYAVNTNAATQYLKFYNSATAPTAGTTTVAGPTIALIQNTPVAIDIKDFGQYFSTGLGICSTGAIIDSDTTNATVGATIDILYK
jgi:hypothetical protein